MFRMSRLNHVDFPIKTTFLRLTDKIETNILDKYIIAIVTKVSYHSRNAMHSLMLNVVNDIRQIYPHLLHEITVHEVMDKSEFRSQFVFHLMIMLPQN